MKVAINGFGRIGRCALRAIFDLNLKNIDVVVINTPGSATNCAHLLKYDSVHGTFASPVTVEDRGINVDGKFIHLTQEKEIEKLNWKKYDIDIVLECSGIFNSKIKAGEHLKAGAKKVLISAPVEDADITIVYGVNHNLLNKDHDIVSIGSCTTNCLAPVLNVLHENLCVENGFMQTVHAYTNDQNIVDNNHKKDLRRARACGLSMIPTSTGAAKTIGKIIPELNGKIGGTAIRVPTANVSLMDLVANVKKQTNAEEVNGLFLCAANKELRDVLSVCNEPLVSIDFNHNSASAIVDALQTKVIDEKLIKISAWYDNEWGFTCRIFDVLLLFSSKNLI